MVRAARVRVMVTIRIFVSAQTDYVTKRLKLGVGRLLITIGSEGLVFSFGFGFGFGFAI